MRRAATIDAGALAVLGLLALLGFRNTYAGWVYLLDGAAGLVAGLAVAWSLRARRQPVIVVAAALMVVFIVLGDLVVAHTITLRATHDLATGAVFGWKRLLTTLPPVPSGDPLTIVPFILGMLCGGVGFLLAQALPAPKRASGAAALAAALAPVAVPILVLAAAIAFGTDTPGAELPDGVAFAVLCLCWIAIRRARTRPLAAGGTRRFARLATAAALLAAASVGAYLLSPVLPGAHASRTVLRDEIVPPFDISEYPSPLVGFRKYTKAANNLYDQTLFTVHGLPAGATVRIATLDDYDGYVWGATGSDDFQRVGASLGTPTGTPTRVTVSITAVYAQQPELSAWLPDAGTVIDVDTSHVKAGATLRFNRGSSDGVVTGRLVAGDTYSFDTVIANPTLPADTQPYAEPSLTDNAESLLQPHIATWAAGAPGLAAELQAVATYLRDNGYYSDGGANETQYLPGHSLGRLSSFVNGPEIVGDDEQYAATYALVANNLGIPARVVFGATPEADGSVRGQDIHAWVEVHVADGSWVPIPQTQFMPDQSRKPDTQVPQQSQNVKAAVVPPPNAVHKPTAITDSQSNETVTPPKPPRKPSLLARIWALIEPVGKYAGPPILLVIAVAGVVLALKWRRRRRRRTAGSTANRYAGGWREVVDLARDAGMAMPIGRTRQQQADVLLAGPAETSRRIPRRRRASSGVAAHRSGRGPLRVRQPRRAPPDYAETVRLTSPYPASPPIPDATSASWDAPTWSAPVAGTDLAEIGSPVATRYPTETVAAIRALADAADLAVYGPEDQPDAAARSYWAQVEAVRKAMLRRYPRRRRLAIRLSVRSLRSRSAYS